MKILQYSEEESDLYGLRIARSGRLQNLESVKLTDEIIKGGFDLVKIKTELSDPNIFINQESLPFFSSPFNIIALQSIMFNEAIKKVEGELSFELYDGSQETEARLVLLDITSQDTNLYYSSDIYSQLISNQQQVSASIEYYLSMNHSLYPDRFLFLGRNHEGTAVGVCSFKKVNEYDAEGVIYGVRPAYRNKRYASLFLQHSLYTLQQANCNKFTTEVQYYNFRSLYPHIHIGFKPAGLYLNFNIYPLLSHYMLERVLNEGCRIENLSDIMRNMLEEYMGNKIHSFSINSTHGVFFDELKILRGTLRLCCLNNTGSIFLLQNGKVNYYIKTIFYI